MKTIFLPLFIIAGFIHYHLESGLLSPDNVSWRQFLSHSSDFASMYEKHTETIRKTLKFTSQSDRNLLILKNVQGFVKVEGYSGAEVQIEAEKTIDANNQDKLEQGLSEFQLVFEEAGDRIFVYLKAPFIQVKKFEDNVEYNIHNDNVAYQYKVDFTVKVPYRTSLKVATINEGDIEVREVRGRTITASNINGHLALENIEGATNASTINGNITATYRESPSGASHYKTINGNITAAFLDNLSADISMKTMNGEYYTNFPNASRTTAKVEKNEDKSGNRTVYKVDKATGIRIGNGEAALDFQTLNGDIYIKETK